VALSKTESILQAHDRVEQFKSNTEVRKALQKAASDPELFKAAQADPRSFLKAEGVKGLPSGGSMQVITTTAAAKGKVCIELCVKIPFSKAKICGEICVSASSGLQAPSGQTTKA